MKLHVIENPRIITISEEVKLKVICYTELGDSPVIEFFGDIDVFLKREGEEYWTKETFTIWANDDEMEPYVCVPTGEILEDDEEELEVMTLSELLEEIEETELTLTNGQYQLVEELILEFDDAVDFMGTFESWGECMGDEGLNRLERKQELLDRIQNAFPER